MILNKAAKNFFRNSNFSNNLGIKSEFSLYIASLIIQVEGVWLSKRNTRLIQEILIRFECLNAVRQNHKLAMQSADFGHVNWQSTPEHFMPSLEKSIG